METSSYIINGIRVLLLGTLLGTVSVVLAADKVDQVVNTGVERNDEAKASQKRIDQIADNTDKVVGKYKRELKVIDGLKVYNALLQKQLDAQLLQMEQIKSSIEEVSIIERQVTPLMLRMVEGLENFIELDVPFLLKERRNRVQTLKDTIARADVTAAEKFRNVLEAFQIENEYGRTIEAYKDVLEVGGKSREVSLLRFGRVTLVYQTEDGESNGVWDQSKRTWTALDAADYRNPISNGLKIARKQVAPELIMLPVSAAEGK